MMDPEELDNLFYRKNPLNRHHMNPVGNFLNEFIPELVTEICFHLTVGETQILLALVTPCVPHELERTVWLFKYRHAHQLRKLSRDSALFSLTHSYLQGREWAMQQLNLIFPTLMNYKYARTELVVEYLREHLESSLMQFSTLQMCELFITTNMMDDGLYANTTALKRIFKSFLGPEEPEPVIVIVNNLQYNIHRVHRIRSFRGIKVRYRNVGAAKVFHDIKDWFSDFMPRLAPALH